MTTNNNPRLLPKTCGFFLIWLLLSESYTLIDMGLGLAAAFGVAWLNTDRTAPRPVALPLRTVLFLPWLVARIFHSGVHLSKLILHPDLPIDPKLLHHHTRLREDAGITLLGNSITLTPGTITVEANSQDLVVHAMDDASAEDVTSLQLDDRIARLFKEEGKV